MKKYLVMTLSLILMITMLVSCGGGEESGASEESVQVGVVLPTKDEARWLQDEVSLRTSLEKAGLTYDILFSQGTTTTELSNVESLLDENIKVLVICSPDTNAAAKAVQEAKNKGVAVVCYDRLIEGIDAVDYYVTFDSYAVGAQQGQYLIDKYAGKKDVPLYIFGGRRDEYNSYLLLAGAWSVLSNAVKNGQFAVQNCPAIAEYAGKTLDVEKDYETLTKILGTINTEWNGEEAAKFAKASLKSGKKGEVAVLAPNDETARAIADVFSEDKGVKKYVITGQDADLQSLKYIMDGKQSMTVRKDTAELAEKTGEMAGKIIAGETPETNSEYNNGAKKVPSFGIATTVVDAETLPGLISDGTYNKEDIEDAD